MSPSCSSYTAEVSTSSPSVNSAFLDDTFRIKYIIYCKALRLSIAGNMDNRTTFDHYLYDYLRRKDLHETAEIFRIEADLTDLQTSPPGVDVPQGFLNEWFQIFYAIHNSVHPVTAQRDEGSSSRANQAHIMHRSYRDLNSQIIDEHTVRSDVGIITDGNVVPSPSVNNDHLSEDSADAEDDSAVLAELFPLIFGKESDNMARDEGSKDVPDLETDLSSMFNMEEVSNKAQNGREVNGSVEGPDQRNVEEPVLNSSREREQKKDSCCCTVRKGERSKRKRSK